MQEEMNSLWKNDTYKLIELPKGRKTLKNKRVFKLKNDNKKLLKYKARLVLKGFGQKQGIDFDEIFSPIVKMCSIRVIIRLAVSMNLELEQLDVKIVFLYSDLYGATIRLQSETKGEHGSQVKKISIRT